MTPLGGFAANDALLGDGNEGYDSNGSVQSEAAWICNWREDNARLWMHRMPVFEGPSLGLLPIPDYVYLSGLARLAMRG
jgi:hypothetical protein